MGHCCYNCSTSPPPLLLKTLRDLKIAMSPSGVEIKLLIFYIHYFSFHFLAKDDETSFTRHLDEVGLRHLSM